MCSLYSIRGQRLFSQATSGQWNSLYCKNSILWDSQLIVQRDAGHNIHVVSISLKYVSAGTNKVCSVRPGFILDINFPNKDNFWPAIKTQFLNAQLN